MSTNLSTYFRQRRLALGLRPGEVVCRMGYKSIAGTTNKIVLFEERGNVRPDLFEKLKAALEIDDATVERLIEQDHREFVQRWNVWADQPIEPHLVFRAMPGVYFRQEIPLSLSSKIAEGVETPEAMEEYAADFAKTFARRCGWSSADARPSFSAKMAGSTSRKRSLAVVTAHICVSAAASKSSFSPAAWKCCP